MASTFRPYVEKLGGILATDFVGNSGEIFYDPDSTTLRISDGDTAGGTVISSGEGGASNELVSGNQTFSLNSDGEITAPTLTVPISDNANPSGTGQTLKFSDYSQQAIIYGPESTSEDSNAQRIIIQGAPGYAGTSGEGGDVYVWAGPGGDADGNGGDIKVRAGKGDGTGSGGYLNFQAGDSNDGSGGTINIESGGSGTYGSGGNITVRAQSGGEITLRTRTSEGSNNNWFFGNDNKLTLPLGGTIDEITTTLVLTPPTAAAGQSLVIRGTTPTGITSDHPGGFAAGDTITITVTPDNGNAVTGTVDYTFTGDFVGGIDGELGTETTGTLTFEAMSSAPVSWTIPAENNMTTFTFTLSNPSGFGIDGLTALTLTEDGSSEDSHIHLVSGDPATVDIFLGDDDSYVKIRKNNGGVVIGTDDNTYHWIFDTDGNLTLPTSTSFPGSTIHFPVAGFPGGSIGLDEDSIVMTADSSQWFFSTDDTLTFPDDTVQSTAFPGIPGPYADDAAATAANVAVGNPYYKSNGQVFVRLA